MAPFNKSDLMPPDDDEGPEGDSKIVVPPPVSVFTPRHDESVSVNTRTTSIPSRTSPMMEILKIVLGGIVGVAVGYSILLFGFNIDLLQKYSGRNVAKPTHRDVGPNESHTKREANSTRRQEPSQQLPADLEPSTSTAEEASGQLPVSNSSDENPSNAAATQSTEQNVDGSAKPTVLASDDSTKAPQELATKLPVPSQDEQLKIANELKVIFKQHYADLSTPAKESALAAALRNGTKDLGDDPVSRFVMLQEAHTHALAARDLRLAEDLASELCATFEVDFLSMQSQMLTTAIQSAKATDPGLLVAKALELIDLLTVKERFDEALVLLETVEGESKRLKVAGLHAKLTAARRKARTEQIESETIQGAIGVLKAVPDDPAANLIVGKHLCFAKGDWATGLRMIAQGNDPKIAATAELDLTAPTEAPQQIEVGDAWWALAESSKADEKHLLRRAAFWYAQSLPRLQPGIDRLKITRRLEEVSTRGLRIRLEELPIAVNPFDGAQAKRFQESWGHYLKTPTEVTNSIGMKFVLIPPGEFVMGSSAEGPQHRVRITRPFYLATYEVTQAQYERVVRTKFPASSLQVSQGVRARQLLRAVRPSHFPVAAGDTPVEQVTWQNAISFCELLAALPEEKQRQQKYRLPTEAEWEFSCRAGTDTRYSFGDDESMSGDYAWSPANAQNQPHPVGLKQSNAFGLYDMHGNVWEWCHDWFAPYSLTPNSPPSIDPSGPAEATKRVLRGSCFFVGLGSTGSATRNSEPPAYQSSNLGFRVVCEVPVKAL